jgi:hypothetical protein
MCVAPSNHKDKDEDQDDHEENCCDIQRMGCRPFADQHFASIAQAASNRVFLVLTRHLCLVLERKGVVARNYADAAVSLASVERIPRSYGARIVVDQICDWKVARIFSPPALALPLHDPHFHLLR